MPFPSKESEMPGRASKTRDPAEFDRFSTFLCDANGERTLLL